MVIVNFATKENLKEIIEVYRGWGEFKGILPDEFIAGDTYEGLLKYFDGRDDSRKYIVAKINDKVIGVCYIDVLFLKLKSIRLGYMFVSREFRRRGVASAMIDKIIEYAKEKDVKKIWLWTQEELSDAIKLYEKKGFVFEGRQKKQFCEKDALVYGLVLN